MIVLYIHCSSTHALPINLIVIWKVLSCDFLVHNCLFMVDLILILNVSLILIIIFSTLNFMYVVICMLNVDNVLYPHGCFEC
jgi:hypothetical protein